MTIDLNTFAQWGGAFTTIVTAAAAAAAVLPQGQPGTTWYVVRSAIDLIACNFGNAANKKKV